MFVRAQPHRVRMTHNLIVSYGLYRDMEVFVRCVPAAAAALPCYVNRVYLRSALR